LQELYSQEGINDSKLIPHKKRIKMAKLIKENSVAHYIIESSADEIDSSLNSGTNLNTLEAQKSAAIINHLAGKNEQLRVIIDCPSVNIIAWKKTLLEYVKNQTNFVVRCEHKADANHISVAAASILAKVAREDAVTELKKKYGDFGSGYPSDPKTKDFLKKNGKELSNEKIFRKTWSTWQKLFPEKKGQTRLF
jgi:ribonuclease HII